ncbi:MAG: short-chain dehydrogenase [Gammaproteobacteria bacterium]|nr:short-chain dehydrogenase [Gammaproteobacteria bacterium]
MKSEISMKNDILKNRVILITGGARGLGREMALAAAHNGAKLCLTGSTSSGVFDQTIKDISSIIGADNLLACVSDVTQKSQVEALVDQALDRFQRIDVLVNNAGRGMRLVSEAFTAEPTKFWETDIKPWKKIIDTNINGPFLMAQSVIPSMLKAGFGKIINISTSAQTMVRQGYSPYGPSKAFLEAATRAWAVELEGTGVDVNILLPGGAADTDLLPQGANRKGADGNLLSANVMSDAFIWLASNASNGITGGRFIGRFWGDKKSFRVDTGQMPNIL